VQRGSRGRGGVVVIPDPDIEQITEDIESLDLLRTLAEKSEKALDRGRPAGGQVEIGDEEGIRHKKLRIIIDYDKIGSWFPYFFCKCLKINTNESERAVTQQA